MFTAPSAEEATGTDAERFVKFCDRTIQNLPARLPAEFAPVLSALGMDRSTIPNYTRAALIAYESEAPTFFANAPKVCTHAELAALQHHWTSIQTISDTTFNLVANSWTAMKAALAKPEILNTLILTAAYLKKSGLASEFRAALKGAISNPMTAAAAFSQFQQSFESHIPMLQGTLATLPPKELEQLGRATQLVWTLFQFQLSQLQPQITFSKECTAVAQESFKRIGQALSKL
jgi:hypothetical protein